VTTRSTTLLVWALLGAGVIGVQIGALVTKGRLPTFNALLHRLTAFRIGQIAMILGWMWLGWHAFAR
jgi:hypothetical protein